MTVTKQDLDVTFERLKASNEDVVEVQKEVAVQLNTIANQLMLLAKSNEEIIALEKDQHAGVKGFIEKEIANIVKDVAGNCGKCIEKVEGCKGGLDGMKGDLKELSGKIDKFEHARIKNSTVYLMVIGAITGGVGLAAAIFKVIEVIAK